MVLDTNVLLDLYRLPSTARTEVLNVLDLLKARLWIPHHVALEFQRRRLTVIAGERKATGDALRSASDLVGSLKTKVDALEIDKRGLGIESQALFDQLTRANDQIVEAIKSAHTSQLEISSQDPVRDRLDALLENRIGPPPADQADIDKLIAGGEDRYKEKIPPGFADADKEKNPNEATFIFDHIKIQRKFGDLILWRQLLCHAKENKVKTIIFVTSDKKEDWWWLEQNKSIGPHPELVREIRREGLVELFWMYSSDQFVEHANKYAAAKVSNESVEEIKQVSLSSPPSTNPPREDYHLKSQIPATLAPDDVATSIRDAPSGRTIEQCVASWLVKMGGEVEINVRGFPDIFVRTTEQISGYDVKYIRSFEKMLLTPIIINSLLRGYLEMNEGRLFTFTQVIVIPDHDFFDIDLMDSKKKLLRQRLSQLLERYPVYAIIVGAIFENEFVPLLVEQNS